MTVRAPGPGDAHAVPAAPRRWSRRHVTVVLGALAAGLLVSLAGKHALEGAIGDGAAIVISHAAGLLVLALIVRRGPFRRARRSDAGERRDGSD